MAGSGPPSRARRSQRGMPRVSRLPVPAACCPLVLRPLLGTLGKACIAGDTMNVLLLPLSPWCPAGSATELCCDPPLPCPEGLGDWVPQPLRKTVLCDGLDQRSPKRPLWWNCPASVAVATGMCTEIKARRSTHTHTHIHPPIHTHFFSSAHGTFSRMDHIPGHKTKPQQI